MRNAEVCCLGSSVSLDLCSGGQERDDPRGQPHGGHVVEVRAEAAEDVEGENDQDGQEKSVVVEDREGGGLDKGKRRFF